MRDRDFCASLKNAFSEELPDVKSVVFEETASTNTEARLYAEREDNAPCFFISKRQSAGRGRRGRSFVSREGGLYLSYLLYPSISAKESVMLTVYSAVALAETIEEISGAKPKIKWVNDIFLGGKKLAGILTEGEFSEDGESFRYAVVGIGVNIKKTDFPEELKGIATDLETECGITADISDFAVRLAKKLVRFESADPSEYIEKYRKYSFVLGKRVKVIAPAAEYFAIAQSINDDASLNVVTDAGETKKIFTGEISIVANIE